jgi:glycosyltransferase involved in cell wall biosynthesis
MSVSLQTTVVVVAHNYSRYLMQSVESAVRQTRRPRILIVDDASTDETPEIAAHLVDAHPAVEYRRLPKNVGLSRVRNLAAEAVETEWVVFLDADDWLDPHYVQHAEAWLAAHEPVDALTTDMTIVREGAARKIFRSRVPARWSDLLERNTIVQTSLIRRDLVARVGGYDPSLDFEDWDFWIRALQAGARIGRLPGPHVFRREHGRNKSKACDERAATAGVRAKHAALM